MNLVPWRWTSCSCILVVCRTGFCSSGEGCCRAQILLCCLVEDRNKGTKRRNALLHIHIKSVLSSNQSAGLQTVHITFVVKQAVVGEDKPSSLPQFQSRAILHNDDLLRADLCLTWWHTCAVMQLSFRIRSVNVQYYFFVQPSSNDHRTVGVSLGSLTSFTKCLYLSIMLLLFSKGIIHLYTLCMCI